MSMVELLTIRVKGNMERLAPLKEYIKDYISAKTQKENNN